GYSRYFPAMRASRRRAEAGMDFRSVSRACARAWPQRQARSSGIWRTAQHGMGILRVLVQGLENLSPGDGIVLRVPAIVVRDHGHGGVTDFRLTGKPGLGEIGHADDVKAELAVHVGFRRGGELR